MEVKLGIGWPLTNEMIHSKFVISWVLMEKSGDISFFLPQFPGPIDNVRNQIVEQALQSECTHLLMMDTDQTYPVNLIPKLISHNLPIVAAKVHRRYPLFDPILYRLAENGKYISLDDEEWKNGGLVEVDSTGTGCVLIRLDVFEDIEYPWFETVYKDPYSKITERGEDINFFVKAKKAGYRVFVDTDLKVGHLSTLEITEEMYFLFKRLTGHKMGGERNGKQNR